MTKLEIQIKRTLTKLEKSDGLFFVKIASNAVFGVWGLPDFFVCYKGLFIAIEAKDVGDRLSPLQKRHLKRLGKAGAKTLIAHSKEDVVEFFASLKSFDDLRKPFKENEG